MNEQKLLKKRNEALRKNDINQLIDVHIALGNLYKDKCQYEFAIQEYKEAGQLYQKRGDEMEYARIKRAIGEVYLELKEFDKALRSQKLHLEIAQKLHNEPEQQRALATIGHIYLSKHLQMPDDDSRTTLNNAEKYLKESLAICKRLNGEASKVEIADMQSRLYANLGIVKEYQKRFDEAAALLEKSINICKQYDLYEQLHRAYISLSSHMEKRGDCRLALQQCNLAIDAAKRLHSHPIYMATALHEKARILVKLGEIKGAKSALLKAYRLKITDKEERKQIENNLRVVAAMCNYEDKIVTSPATDYANLKNYYEKMGDGACELKLFDRAIDYYKKMLEAATKKCASNSELATCYYSLGETYKDNGDYSEAVSYFQKELDLCQELKDKLNTLSKIADTKESANSSVEEIEQIYNTARKLCQDENNTREEGRMLKRFMIYLKRQGRHLQAAKLQPELDKLDFVSTDSDGENTSEGQAESHIGSEINLDEITDLDDDSDCEQSSSKRRRSKISVKKNKKGETELHSACINGALNVVKLLLERGHPVNVRDNCGWLPIHEASNLGHYDIVKALIEKGANVNDRGGELCEGVTPLHDAASNGHLKVMELLIKNGANAIAVDDSGKSVLHYLKIWRSNNHLNEEDEILYKTLVNQMSSALDKAGHVDSIASTSSNIGPYENNTPPKKNLRRSKTVGLEDELFDSQSTIITEDYRNTIESLRKRNSPKKTPPLSQKRPALIEGSDYVDDWLEDDLPKNHKKRKTNSPYKSSNANDIINSDSSNDTDTTSFSSIVLQSGHKKRKRQAKLTSFGHTRSREEADSTSSSHVSSFNSPIKQSESLIPSLVQPIEPTLGVDVKIEEKLYRVPVLLSQVNTNSIKWLAEEAAARYAKKEYVKPVLELQTKSGAILADDDLISIIFPFGNNQAEPVEARIIKWNVPPITERFKEACHDMSTEPNAKICKALEELSISLDMSYSALKPSSIAPLCKSLNRQTNLQELDLSGNYLSNECFKLLSLSLPTLQSLTKLDLCCTGLKPDHLKTISDTLKSQETPLIIEDLNLSGNFLTDNSFEDLSVLCNSLKLKRLNLALNGFKNCSQKLSLTYVEDFDISDNQFDNNSAFTILSSLRISNMKRLNISRNKLNDKFLFTLLESWKTTNCEVIPLEKLEMSHCNVQDSDLFDLLSLMENLKTAELSYNNDLTSTSLRRLLQSSSVVNINLIGCNNILKYFSDFTKLIELPLIATHVDKNLKLTVDNAENQAECDYLISLFNDWFRERVRVEKCSRFLHLSTL